MLTKSCETAVVQIWMAGDYACAVQACREFTMRGLCVSVTPADFVFTMGLESGVCVTLINYPRFPASAEQIESTAIDLATFLMGALFQGSCSVVGPNETTWLTRRPQDAPE